MERIMKWNEYPAIKPKERGEYIVFDGDHVYTREWSHPWLEPEGDYSWWYRDCCADDQDNDITHWMHFPEAPQ